MSAPRTLQDPPVEVTMVSDQATAAPEALNARLLQDLREAELNLVIESVASRLLSFALAREGEEYDAETG